MEEKEEKKEIKVQEADYFYKRVGRNLNYYRTGTKITQADIAKIAGVSRSHVSRVEQGKDNISAHLLYCYSEALSISPEVLLGTVGNKSKSVPYLKKVETDIKEQLPDLDEKEYELIVSIIRKDFV